MLVLEAKLKGKQYQYNCLNEAIRTALFIRNKALRHWMDHKQESHAKHAVGVSTNHWNYWYTQW